MTPRDVERGVVDRGSAVVMATRPTHARPALACASLMLSALVLAAACVSQPLGDGAAPAFAGSPLHGPLGAAGRGEIFSPAALPGSPEAAEIALAGYVEEEFLVPGIANIYRSGAAGPEVVQAGLAYVTRIVVLRPSTPQRFSGVAHLTAFHPNFAGNQWSRIAPHVLRSGDAFVVVGIGSDTRSRDASRQDAPAAAHWVTEWYDPKRYGAMDWPDDDGAMWDAFSDVARRLRAGGPSSPLGPYRVTHVYASGWSYLGSFLRTFINEGFHDRLRSASGAPLIDGYLIGISSPRQSPGYLPVSASEPAPSVGHPRRSLKLIDAPVIELLSENEAVANGDEITPSGDEAKGGRRLYELAGVSHGDIGVATSRTSQIQLAVRNHAGLARETPCAFAISDVPMRDVASAALANLHAWAKTGAPPPPSARLTTRSDGSLEGGVPVAQIDVPLARYGDPGGGACAGPYRVIRRLALSADELARAYPGGAKEYLVRFDARLQELVAQRWLLPEDADRQQRQAREAAGRAFAGSP